MGCHTWYRKLTTNNQQEVENIVKDCISASKFYYWYELKSLNDLFDSNEKVEQEIAYYVYNSISGLSKVNGIFGLYQSAGRYDIDEPRISNYPDTIITSAEQMFQAMESGLTNSEGKHANFSWNKERDKAIRKNIIEFFNQYPDGIIEFG